MRKSTQVAQKNSAQSTCSLLESLHCLLSVIRSDQSLLNHNAENTAGPRPPRAACHPAITWCPTDFCLSVLRWTSWGTVFLLWVFPHCGGLTAKLCPTFATPWTVAHQSPLSMGFSRQEYWNGLPFPSPGDLPDPGIEPGSPALHGGRGGVLRPSSILIKRILILFEHGAYLGTVPNSQSGPDTGNQLRVGRASPNSLTHQLQEAFLDPRVLNLTRSNSPPF